MGDLKRPRADLGRRKKKNTHARDEERGEGEEGGGGVGGGGGGRGGGGGGGGGGRCCSMILDNDLCVGTWNEKLLSQSKEAPLPHTDPPLVITFFDTP